MAKKDVPDWEGEPERLPDPSPEEAEGSVLSPEGEV